LATTRPHTFIALLRGINVGGNSKVSMQDLKACFESLGFQNIRTYIQSGNIVFDSPKKLTSRSPAAITTAIEKACGIRPEVLLLTAKDLQAAVDANPFPEAVDDPSRLHLFFLAAAPKSPKHDAIEKLKTSTERYRLIGSIFYLHAPDGIGRSKLAAAVERHLGVPTTARNWRTVQEILSLT
jgi:uncharacterized protein (DUF1697 family)